MKKKEETMYLVNVFQDDMIIDQHVVTEVEAVDYVSQATSIGLKAMVMKITRALSVDDNGIIVC